MEPGGAETLDPRGAPPDSRRPPDPDTQQANKRAPRGRPAVCDDATGRRRRRAACSYPQVERQAADRIHRLGQFRPIRVVRLTVAGTVEDRLLKLQEKKQLVFESTVGRSTEALARLTAEDLAFLFS